MADYTAKRIDDMEAIRGRFVKARAELGVSAFVIGGCPGEPYKVWPVGELSAA